MTDSSVQSPADPLRAALGAYLDALDELDRDAALAQVRRVTVAGHPLPEIVRQVLAPAQVEVGRRWEAAERSAAWEHAATAITECALLSAPWSPPERVGRMALVCAQGEGHTMAARMAAQLLEAAGWDPLLLPQPMDAAHLSEFLDRFPMHAVGISCTLTANLPGCAPLIDTAHRAGLPVVAGGAAVRDEPDRATRLGADYCAVDTADAARRLDTWRDSPPDRLAQAVPGDPEHARLGEAAGELVEEAMVVLAREYPGWPADWSEADAAREDFSHALGLLHAALLVADERIVTDGLAWRRRYWTARHEPMDAVARRLAALAEVVPPELPRTAGLLAACLD